MDIAALVTWVLTAGGGFVLLATWFSHRGRPDVQPSRIGPGPILAHFALAAAGLVIWLVHVLGVDAAWLRWVALLILLVVAGLGFVMFSRWLSDRRGTPAATPEQRFPVPVVAMHGVLGAVTLVLVALAVFGVGAD